MSNLYLLTTSLLTGGGMSAPPPPPLPANPSDSLSSLLVSTANKALQAGVSHKIVPTVETTVETSSPQFSSQWQKRSAAKLLQPFSDELTSLPLAASPLNPPILGDFNSRTPQSWGVRGAKLAVKYRQRLPNYQPTTPSPKSGTELYYQRLAALRAGKLYTRLPAHSFSSFWAKGLNHKGVPLTKPTYQQWKQLLAQEARAVAYGQGNNRLSMVVGDSLSLWLPAQGLPNYQLWLNQGISGENTSQILSRLSAFSQTRPDTIYVMAGINDLRQGKTDQVILNNLRQITRQLRQNHPQAQLIIQSILPTRATAISNQRIRNLNQQIAQIAQQEGAAYLNLHKLFTDSKGQMQHNLTTDGIHLTPLGYQVWQEALQYTESLIAANRAKALSL
ncbi:MULTISPECIES: GDSL-type esterase/lipase family protein [unclassified Moorena]|uniref:GDSL-type esterase/lipase family protein n=1 Tax=unclassified Moorena TaxID=2683338 RepID=UPI001400A684|nr:MULTISPECIES: GDSL-type esterase/lipase family protein [unclassified Moorena]NEO16948.1 acylhydrolase [Moorena sp. SIO3E8]NEP99983.1 acylhydrolase [Moorena sp. SIO3F7]